MANTQNSKAPVARVRVKTVQGSIFQHVTAKGKFFNVSFQVGYRDSEGNWKNGQSYDLNGLLALEHAVGQAIDKILALKTDASGHA